MRLTDLVAYLDEYLEIYAVPDYRDAHNGLQVEGAREVERVAVCVDACAHTIEEAARACADLMIVHHGLFWGGFAPITEGRYRRLCTLIQAGIALYSAHLPLDVHPEVGNNAVLARRLGLTPSASFAPFEGTPIGLVCEADMTRDDLAERVSACLGSSPYVIATGPAHVRRLGILTGGGGSRLREAAEAGCDTLLTGEGPHHTYFEAEERGLNALYAGHYATETLGVRALAAHLERRFGLDTLFVDHPTGL